MLESGAWLYLVLAVILGEMWRRVRGRSFEQVLTERTAEHHRVQRALAEHPRGGSWREFRRWWARTPPEPH
ncbi:MAG: hypothetical protein GWO02_07890 [Gammaproteobacteria bacterium]|nr:hypothetical protein [Gammaproteobacteria bacterium]